MDVKGEKKGKSAIFLQLLSGFCSRGVGLDSPHFSHPLVPWGGSCSGISSLTPQIAAVQKSELILAEINLDKGWATSPEPHPCPLSPTGLAVLFPVSRRCSTGKHQHSYLLMETKIFIFPVLGTRGTSAIAVRGLGHITRPCHPPIFTGSGGCSHRDFVQYFGGAFSLIGLKWNRNPLEGSHQ